MAGVGPPPKDPKKRRRRNAPDSPSSTVSADGRTRGPALPSAATSTPDGERWHPRTVAWWANWRKSAQAKVFLQTDWDFLLDTALMHHVMWTKGRWEFASEIRLRVAKFGATADDRMRLKMEVETPGAKPQAATPPAGVTDIASRRKRLQSA